MAKKFSECSSKFVMLMIVLVGTLNINGQSKNKTENEIRALEQTVVTAILKADTNTLKLVWAPEFLVNNPRNNISANRQAVLEAQRTGLINYSSFERIIESILIQTDVVITMGYETFVSNNDTPGVKAGQNYKRRFTNIWRKKNGKWVQIAKHASII